MERGQFSCCRAKIGAARFLTVPAEMAVILAVISRCGRVEETADTASSLSHEACKRAVMKVGERSCQPVRSPVFPLKREDSLLCPWCRCEFLGALQQKLLKLSPGEIGEIIQTAAGAAGHRLAHLTQVEAVCPGLISLFCRQPAHTATPFQLEEIP